MWKTILHRILLMVPQLLVLSIIVFALGQLMPGGPFTGLITPDMDPKVIAEIREREGLNQSILQQYKDWITRILREGDFGRSYNFKIPVIDLIGSRAANTLALSLLTLLITYLIAIPLGMYGGRYEDSLLDRSIIAYSFISYAVPSFVLGLLLLLIFGYRLKWFPTEGSVGLGLSAGTFLYYKSRIYHMLLPAITSALLGTTGIIQYLRSEVIESKKQDYVKLARSKGIPLARIYTHHILRNSLIPIAAFLGFNITGLLGGSVFIETIFSYPGMGQLFISSIEVRDYSVINSLVLLFGFLALLGSLISDIIMAIVDPRIRIE